MSILIKGMEKPETCSKCPFCQFDGLDLKLRCLVTDEDIFFDAKKKRAGNCPLVEIPPHGDLIDRDAVRKEFAEMCEQCGEKYDAVCRACYVDTCDDIIDDVPPVIESEEQEHE